MIKKIMAVSVLGVSALGMMAANATTNGIYVAGQLGYADTHLGNKTGLSDMFSPYGIKPSDVNPSFRDKNLSNSGLAGRIALGYQFNQNFAVEAGYLQLGNGKINLGSQTLLPIAPSQVNLNLHQNVFDLVGKGILPVGNNFNVYGKLGVAYVTTNISAKAQTPGLPTINANFNTIAKHKWAPEVALGVSYDITPNVFIDTSWTHIQPIGKNRPGNIDFAAVGLGYSFG